MKALQALHRATGNSGSSSAQLAPSFVGTIDLKVRIP